ncbi:hypothetical protein EFBL_3301 [Effusibacillus lacus]|uniref:Glycosyltransferase 2-like domain-containing protein n=2 Tax=Effusibacillus lacus TaxID=1348429 RepID=A0A292YRS1_9BACL|nr:hypothetical protein EFBL_3301 [Effusibacillus lacus]
MIVKNEEEHLPRCLKSVKGAVDEIIVVDTGSTDGTVEVARQWGAHVIRSSWQNDFAYARNVGIEQAKGDWILWLDADEELEAADRKKLREYAKHQEYEAFLLQIHNYVGDGSQGATINPVLRMFRNRPTYRFEGRIHEQIAASIYRHKPEAAFHIAEIKIHHYGYQQEIVTKKDKIRRNLNLLRQMAAEQPEDPFTQYNLGVEYLRSSDVKQALDAFRMAKSLLDPAATSYAHLLFKYEIWCLLALGRVEEANRICDEGIDLYPQYTDLHHLKGVCLTQLGKPEEAKNSFLHAIELGPAPSGYHTEEGMGTYQTCYALGMLYEAVREYNNAVEWYLQAVHFKSSLNPPLYRIFHLMRCTGAQSRIVSFIDERFHLRTENAVAKIIDILFETDCLEPIPALAEQLQKGNFKEFKLMVQIKSLLLAGNLKGVRNAMGQLRFKDKAKFKKWLAWAEHGSDPAEDDSLSTEELSLAVKIAFKNGRFDDTLRMISKWLQRLDEPESGKRIIRTLSSLADSHLGVLGQSPRFGDLVRDARLAAPCEDGFSGGTLQ